MKYLILPIILLIILILSITAYPYWADSSNSMSLTELTEQEKIELIIELYEALEDTTVQLQSCTENLTNLSLQSHDNQFFFIYNIPNSINFGYNYNFNSFGIGIGMFTGVYNDEYVFRPSVGINWRF